MTEAGKKVLAGMVRLSESEREEVITKLNEFIRAQPEKRGLLKEEFVKAAGMIMGPVTSGCACCGK